MARHLIRSVATLNAIKTATSERRVIDGAGLHLLLFVKRRCDGCRFDYSIEGRRKTLSLRTYTEGSQAEARQKAEETQRLVRTGTDPSAVPTAP